MKVRSLLASAAVAALLITGCASNGESSGGESEGTSSQTTATATAQSSSRIGTPSAGSTVDPQAVDDAVQQALTDAQTYKLESTTVTSATIGASASQTTVSYTTEVDNSNPDEPKSHGYLDGGGEIIAIGNDSWQKAPTDTTWTHQTLTASDFPEGTQAGDVSGFFANAETITYEGTETINGVEARHFTTTVDTSSSEAQTTPSEFYLDSQDRPVRMVLSMDTDYTTSRTQMDFSDYGADFDIEPPA